jgi:hypothetical protein
LKKDIIEVPEEKKKRESVSKLSKVEQTLLMEKAQMKEFGFLKHMMHNKSVGPDKVGWPAEIKILFQNYDLKMQAREKREEMEKEKKAESRKVRPH